MDGEDDDEFLRTYYPVHTNMLPFPDEHALKIIHNVYSPSVEALRPSTEQKRSVFAEAFIHDQNLGTLANMCRRAMSRYFGVPNNEGKSAAQLRRLQLDAIPVDHPLEDMYDIDDDIFWKRITLAKTSEIHLRAMGMDYDWKSEGVTLKYVELIEECPAEYLPVKKMTALAQRIKEHVKHMKIRKLQPQQEFAFAKYAGRDSDTDKDDSTDVSNTTEGEMTDAAAVTSQHSSDVSEEEDERREERRDDSGRTARKPKDEPTEIESFSGSMKEYDPEEGSEEMEEDVEEIPQVIETPEDIARMKEIAQEIARKKEHAEEIARMMEALQKRTARRREERRQRREAQKRRRQHREEKRRAREEEANRPQKKIVRVKNVFDLPIVEPKDEELKKRDERNVESQLNKKRKNIYLTKRCHHIDLGFIRNFDNLVSFQIEFRPPDLKAHYHARLYEFSYDDVRNLAKGIIGLENLRIFRLRFSRMDEDKLAILVTTLRQMNIETIDFGNDYLTDDCDIALYELFQGTTTIKALELEGNDFDFLVLASLGRALRRYTGQFEYLGLARNPLTSNGLHALMGKIADTPQVTSICLAGVHLSERTLQCCIFNELLTVHKCLRSLDITCSTMSDDNGEIMANRMYKNFNLLELDIRGCCLCEEIELEIAIYLDRNNYVVRNPFIGDKKQTEQAIKSFVNRTKNGIIIAAYEKFQKNQELLNNRPDIAMRYSFDEGDGSLHSSIMDMDFGRIADTIRVPIADTIRTQQTRSEPTEETLSEEEAEEEEEDDGLPFVFDVMQFNEKQFHQHIEIPGPNNRYEYLKLKKRKME